MEDKFNVRIIPKVTCPTENSKLYLTMEVKPDSIGLPRDQVFTVEEFKLSDLALKFPSEMSDEERTQKERMDKCVAKSRAESAKKQAETCKKSPDDPLCQPTYEDDEEPEGADVEKPKIVVLAPVVDKKVLFRDDWGFQEYAFLGAAIMGIAYVLLRIITGQKENKLLKLIKEDH